MKGKIIKIITPVLATFILSSCGGGGGSDPTPTVTVTDMAISLVKSPIYVGNKIETSGFNVAVFFSNGSIKTVDNYKTTPSLPYTFTKEDAENGGKEFQFTYNEFSKKVTFPVYEPSYAEYCTFEKIDDNNVMVSKKAGATLKKSLALPGSVEGTYVKDGEKGKTYNVTTVKEDGFKGDTRLTSIYFSEGINVISKGSFAGCTSLKYVRFSNTVNEIKAKAFGENMNDIKLETAAFDDLTSKWSIEGLGEGSWWTPRPDANSDINAGVLTALYDKTFEKNLNN